VAMNPDTLALELQNLSPVATEAAAIVNFVNAYGVFAADAEAGPATITPAAVTAGKAAMQAALVGMSASGAGATIMFNGVVAFWAAVAALLAGAFAGSTAITPPPHAGLVVGLTSVFASNTSSALSKNDATQNVAAVFYSEVITAGFATFPPGTLAPIL